MGIGKIDPEKKWGVSFDKGSTFTDIYIPSSIKVEHENIVGPDSGRLESGYMHIDWVRRDVTKVFLTYDYLTGSEAAYLKSLMQGKEFRFKFYDEGRMLLLDVYCGKCSYEQKNLSVRAADGGLYKDFKINVEEM